MKEYDDVKCIACGDEGCEYCKEDSELIVYNRIMSKADCEMASEIAETLDRNRKEATDE